MHLIFLATLRVIYIKDSSFIVKIRLICNQQHLFWSTAMILSSVGDLVLHVEILALSDQLFHYLTNLLLLDKWRIPKFTK